MTKEQAEEMQPGDTVFTAACPAPGRCKIVRMRLGNRTDRSWPSYQVDGDLPRPVEWLFRTHAEAHADTIDRLRRQVAERQAALADLEAR